MKKFWLLISVLVFFTGCLNAPQTHETGNIEVEIFSGDKINLKYPVVLVHGILAHDRRSLIDFWGRIPDILRKNGINVYFGGTDAWGSYESNALLLKDTIDRILLETESEKVNIIAHSKGGIDSRYLIWRHNYGDKVASLTTVSTPHHGAELADLIFQQRIVHTNMTKRALDIFGRLYGDINPDMFNLNYQLTTVNMKQFNQIVVKDERVFYQSYYTTMRNPFDDIMFFYSFLYIRRVSGANDGIVSEVSSMWSDNITKIERISHAEIVDFKKRKISGINIPDIFLDIVRDLSNRGF
jgi:triacylglycerol lipase